MRKKGWHRDLVVFFKKEGIPFKEGVSLKRISSIKIGGVIDFLALPKEREKLICLVEKLMDLDIPYYVIGGGTKILPKDERIEAVGISTERLARIEIVEEKEREIKIFCECGVRFNQIISLSLKKGFFSFEFLSGIPGTVGGGIRMNAGAFGKDFSQFLEKVELLSFNGKITRFFLENRPSFWGYRRFKKEGIILGGLFSFPKTSQEKVKEEIKNCVKLRREKQPLNKPSFGSVFKNPEGNYAGRLIEEAGLKGKVYGNAMISSKHANFIINLGNARAEEVLYLMNLARERVYQKFNLLLEPEVNFIGIKF